MTIYVAGATIMSVLTQHHKHGSACSWIGNHAGRQLSGEMHAANLLWPLITYSRETIFGDRKSVV